MIIEKLLREDNGKSRIFKVVKISELGSAFWADTDNVLFSAPLNQDNTVDFTAAGEVTAPESQEALDMINDALYMNLKMSQFDGR